jgi:hypothetical protein
MATTLASFVLAFALGGGHAQRVAISKNAPQRLTPQGVLQLRTLLTTMEMADEQANSPDRYAREALQLYSSFDNSLP